MSKETVEYYQEEAKCPYCHKALSKAPSRKSKCPHCENEFYVRTRPSDRKKVIITEEGAKSIEQDWENYHAIQAVKDLESLPKDLPSYDKMHHLAKAALQRKENDKAWGLLNKARMEAAGAGKFGIYRNITQTMAKQLTIEGKYKHALAVLCEVAYYDFCGTTNNGYIWEVYNPYGLDIDTRFIAPGNVEMIRSLIIKTGMNQNEFQAIALNVCERIISSLKAPLPSSNAIPVIMEIAFGEKDAKEIKLPTLRKTH